MIDTSRVAPLRNPLLIAAFEGWNDAGEAASDLVAHLVDVWDAEVLGELDADAYYDFQVNRPRVSGLAGERTIEWRTTRVHIARPHLLPRDVVLVQGIEPSFRWHAFLEELLGVAAQLGVSDVLTLGALLADSPHTRPIPVSATAEASRDQARFGVSGGTYEGPTGIVGVLADAAHRAGLGSVSLWAAVPHYAGHTPSPKATLAILSRAEDLFDITIPRGDLEESARAWERGVEEVAQSDGDMAEYVRALEEQQDTTELPEASGDAIAKEFERYLRRRDDGNDAPQG
ncbi:MAG: PAC2 family protein [Micrococcales bacterium]|nr:PAC2 family protein [Micrococcales bacterium]